ncbi:serine/threonine transporter SstT [Sessilibacter corallicola]|uniref:serine/threonine transporter SstT n=1 Tax=Sessilibacter corallicola TaxID=2904075 RepID=UPI001E632704|nr:serine/threonine transporter SstT [Sessilibacter corallicola]MCE2027744.1 serine/threonine transporter SstT [Sessilibacter corallicola]
MEQTIKTSPLSNFFNQYLIVLIALGIVLGAIVGSVAPSVGVALGLFGELFVGALRAVAPILVFTLLLTAIATRSQNSSLSFGPIISLYAIGTFSAAFIAVVLSMAFPSELILNNSAGDINPPNDVKEVLRNLLFRIVDNPNNALVTGNYIALVAWAIALGFALRGAAESTKTLLSDCAQAISTLTRWVIRLAPIGVFGLVCKTVAQTGLGAMTNFVHLLAVLLASMLLVALVVNPLIAFVKLRRNPYPLIFTCLKESGITAFFTRSSAANIPVNLELCRRLKLNEELYSVSIPLGANVNMAGAAITITVMTLAAVNTLGIEVSFVSALLLSIIAAVSACGASGVAGGSLLLIPLACNLFGISGDVASQVIAIGFVISVVQDSAETALNSSTDVVFTASCSDTLELNSSDKS